MDDSVTTNERPGVFAAALEEKLLLNLENQPQRHFFFLFTEQSHRKGKIHKVIKSLRNHEVQLLEQERYREKMRKLGKELVWMITKAT